MTIDDFQPRQIGPFASEVLTLGVSDNEGKCILVEPDKEVLLGSKLYELFLYPPLKRPIL